MTEGMFTGRSRGVVRCALIAGLLTIALSAVHTAGASAAPCPKVPLTESTAWIAGSGDFGEDGAWTNGTPSGSCDVTVTPAGSPTITMTGGFNMKSLTLGGPGSTPSLVISAQSPNTNLSATTTGVDIAAGASITLTCPASPGECLGGPTGGAGLNSGSATIENAGTITVDANSGTGAAITGPLENAGTININQNTRYQFGTLLNQGDVNIADGKVFKSTAEHCGNTGTVFFNDAGGTLDAAGTGTLDVINYEQGDGDSTGTNPVQIPCGSLKYTGDGDSKVRAYGGFGLTGEMQENQSLFVSPVSSNTNVNLQTDFTNGGSITIDCVGISGSCGGSGVGFNLAGRTFTNTGTFTFAADGGTGSGIGGGTGSNTVNTGTIQFNQSAYAGAILNKGAINVADGKSGSTGGNCNEAGSLVKNDTGGSINGTGTGSYYARNYEQGNGTTTGTTPVIVPGGCVHYSGNGTSAVRATGGINLTGSSQAGQALTVSAESNNTNVFLQSDFTNGGSITLTCKPGDCIGSGGVGFNTNGKAFTNAGTFTIAFDSGPNGSGIVGATTNTGTIQFDQTGYLGTVLNRGAINVADGRTASTGGFCNDPGSLVKNDTGGSINATGTGKYNVAYFEQGNGTTTGTTPVTVYGCLNYTGGGASTVLATGGGVPMTGNIAAGQILRIVGGINSAPFTNAGTILLDQATSDPFINTSGTLTNTGTIATVGASAKTSNINGNPTIEQTGANAVIFIATGTTLSTGSNAVALKAGRLAGTGVLNGSVDNTGGTVAPGASPGTLMLSGNYTQGSGGSLAIEVEGTGGGQFDRLAIGGNATLGGTLALQPTAAYVAAAAPGDSVDFLTYGGTRAGQFASTTVGPPPECADAFNVAYDDGAKKASLVVADNSAMCLKPEDPPQKQPDTTPATPVTPVTPDTVLGGKPKGKVKIKKGKAKVKFSFTSTVSGATFECKLDRGAYGPCASPRSFKAKPGKHTFSVRAVAGGVTDPTPASFTFKVVKKKKR